MSWHPRYQDVDDPLSHRPTPSQLSDPLLLADLVLLELEVDQAVEDGRRRRRRRFGSLNNGVRSLGRWTGASSKSVSSLSGWAGGRDLDRLRRRPSRAVRPSSPARKPKRHRGRRYDVAWPGAFVSRLDQKHQKYQRIPLFKNQSNVFLLHSCA